MSFTAGLYCSQSDRLYPVSPHRYVCDDSVQPLAVVYDYEAMSEAMEFEGFGDSVTLERFAPLLPFDLADSLRHLDVHRTPIETLAVGESDSGVDLKDESALPTGTTWDRGSRVLRGLMDEWDIRLVYFTNPGPAGLSLAETLGDEDSAALLTTEPHRNYLEEFPGSVTPFLVEVDSTEELNQLALSLGDHENWMFGTPGWNPYYREGLKTVSLEIYEQCETIPDHVYVAGRSEQPVRAVKKGFVELRKLGWIENRPRIVGVRPTDSATPPSDSSPGVSTFYEDAVFPEEPSDVETVTVSPAELEECRERFEDELESPNSWSTWLGLAGYRKDGPSPTDSSLIVDCGNSVPGTDTVDRSPRRVTGRLDDLINELERLVNQRRG